MDNGERTEWFADPNKVLKLESLRQKYPIRQNSKNTGSMEAISQLSQLGILMRRGWIKTKRDATLTHLRYFDLTQPIILLRETKTIMDLRSIFFYLFSPLVADNSYARS